MRLPQTPFILKGMMGRGGDGGVARWLGKCSQTCGGLVDWKTESPRGEMHSRCKCRAIGSASARQPRAFAKAGQAAHLQRRRKVVRPSEEGEGGGRWMGGWEDSRPSGWGRMGRPWGHESLLRP